MITLFIGHISLKLSGVINCEVFEFNKLVLTLIKITICDCMNYKTFYHIIRFSIFYDKYNNFLQKLLYLSY